MSVIAVVQFGLAMMPRFFLMSAALISGTTSGTSGSMRKALELSTTTAPACVAKGAYCREIPAPALKSATSTPANDASVSSCTTISSPLKGSVFPAERALASSVSFPTGNFRFSSVFIISIPTAPVAPTMATCRFLLI